MRIVLTGASGGIGRSLMATLGTVHEVTGVVRTPRPSTDGQRYVAFEDKPALARYDPRSGELSPFPVQAGVLDDLRKRVPRSASHNRRHDANLTAHHRWCRSGASLGACN